MLLPSSLSTRKGGPVETDPYLKRPCVRGSLLGTSNPQRARSTPKENYARPTIMTRGPHFACLFRRVHARANLWGCQPNLRVQGFAGTPTAGGRRLARHLRKRCSWKPLSRLHKRQTPVCPGPSALNRCSGETVEAKKAAL